MTHIEFLDLVIDALASGLVTNPNLAMSETHMRLLASGTINGNDNVSRDCWDMEQDLYSTVKVDSHEERAERLRKIRDDLASR